MKRPYRAGSTFDIPIVGGRDARGIVLEAGGEVAVLGLRHPEERALCHPEERAQRASRRIVARVHDRALILHRWPIREPEPGFDRTAWPAAESQYVESPETFADRAHALLDGAAWVRPRVVVRNRTLIEPPNDPRLLRIVGKRSDILDARTFASRSDLVALDLAGITLTYPEALADLPALRVLRLCAVRAGNDLEWLTATRLTHLYLYGAYQARSLEPLTRMSALRQLDARGAWQFGIHEMDWKADFGRLEAVTIDIGSRRKNAELYRTFAPPYPEPFERAVTRAGD